MSMTEPDKISDYIKWLVLVLVAALGISWITQGSDFFLLKVFAPKYEAVRRDTFEQSKAYRQGMIQEISAMQMEYLRTDPVHKAALAAIILHRTADFDVALLPPDLAEFISQLKREGAQP